MASKLERLIKRIRRDAARHPYDATQPCGSTPDVSHELLVHRREFSVDFTLSVAAWRSFPEYVLIISEIGKERPNKKAIRRLVSLFFNGRTGRWPVLQADRRFVVFGNFRIFAQVAPWSDKRRRCVAAGGTGATC